MPYTNYFCTVGHVTPRIIYSLYLDSLLCTHKLSEVLSKNSEYIINNKNAYDLWNRVHAYIPAQNPGRVLLVLSK